jgi:hypothetical protein
VWCAARVDNPDKTSHAATPKAPLVALIVTMPPEATKNEKDELPDF